MAQATAEESGNKKSERSREIERWHGIREEEGGNTVRGEGGGVRGGEEG